MNHILQESLVNYIESNTSQIHPYLQQVERNTHLNVLQSHMVSGAYQAKLLQMLCQMIHAKKVLEIGTYTGFATLAFAEVIPENGKIITIEADKEIHEIAKKNIDESPWKNKVFAYLSNALEILPNILSENEIDLIFIDADKKNNINYYNIAVESLKSGSLIITDNVLWKGMVLNEHKDTMTKVIDDFNTYVKNDERVDGIVLPIRDGLSIVRKK